MNAGPADPPSVNEQIVELLRVDGPLSIPKIVRRLHDQGVTITSHGQAKTRLLTLVRRGRVVKEAGEHGAVWRLVDSGRS